MNRSGSTTRDRVSGGRRAIQRSGTGIPPRPDRRRTRALWRRRPLQLAAVLTALAGLGWLLWLSPVLAVRAVQVDGLTTVGADEVREAARVAEGVPLLRVDVGAVVRRVAELPRVRSVEVARSWPDRIVITVAERVPVAVVGAPGRRWLVDADGVLFDTVTGAPPRGVVPLDVDEPGTGDPETMAGVAAIRALPAGLRKDVDRVAVPDAEHIEITLRDGPVVRWGDAASPGTKAQVLAALVARIADGELDPAAVIDVSTPDAVVLR